MRCESAARAKGSKKSFQNLRPKPDTKIGQLYDLFIEHKGLPIDLTVTKHNNRALRALEDFYGLDIRRLSRGRWVLAGEWFGKIYVDYIAERLSKSEPHKAP